MNNKLIHTFFAKSPFYSLRVFYIFRLCLSGIAVVFFGYKFNSDTSLANLLNGDWRYYVGIGMFLMGMVGMIGLVFRDYLFGLAFAILGLLFFGILAFDYLRHDIRNIVATIYCVDMLANAWLFFKLRFDRHDMGI